MGSTYSPPRGLFLATNEDFDMAMDKYPRQPLILNPPLGRLICSRLGDGLGADPTCRPIGSK